MTASASPWTRARVGQLDARRQHRAPGHEPEVPAPAEQEQGDEQDLAALRRRERRQQRRHDEDPSPRKIVRMLPNRCAIQPDTGASANIPTTWPLMTSADRAETVAVVGRGGAASSS